MINNILNRIKVRQQTSRISQLHETSLEHLALKTEQSNKSTLFDPLPSESFV